MIIVLKEFLDTHLLVTPEKAKKVRDAILEAVHRKSEIVLDFSEIKAVTLSFLYYAFRGIRKELSRSERSLVRIENPTSFLMEEIEYLKNNYRDLARKFAKIEEQKLLMGV